jgi:F-type H+-transporting ATPase subunit epsilon
MPFQVDVVSPEAVVWTGEADFLVARTTEGEIGILTDHEPVMAALATGAVIIESGNERTTVGVHGGFLQVLQNRVTLLTDRAEIATGGREGAAELAAELSRIEEEQAEAERTIQQETGQQETGQQETGQQETGQQQTE